jgi:antibiotic biosynthesis monooxygenase (ABM) superfamily enzyme
MDNVTILFWSIVVIVILMTGFLMPRINRFLNKYIRY